MLRRWQTKRQAKHRRVDPYEAERIRYAVRTIPGRLFPIIRSPEQYVQRQVDELCDLTRQSMEWKVRLQILLPHARTGEFLAEPLPHVVPLGNFPKKYLPDLVARDAAGREIVVLSRPQRTMLLRRLLSLSLLQVLPELDSTFSTPRINELLEAIINSDPESAAAHYLQYKRFLKDQIAASSEPPPFRSVAVHLKTVRGFISHTVVLALVTASAGSVLALSYSFTERPAGLKRPKRRDSDLEGSGMSYRLVFARWFFANLGLLAMPFDLRLNGSSWAKSYYLVIREMSGTEIESAYWERVKDTGTPGVSYGVTSGSVVLSCYNPLQRPGDGSAKVNVRLDGRALRMLWLLLGVVVGVGMYVAWQPSGDTPKVVALFAALPAGLIGLITQTKHALVMAVSAWLRRLCVLLSVMTAGLGVAMAGNFSGRSGGYGGVAGDRVLASGSASFAAFLFVLFTYICWRPAGPAASDTGPVHLDTEIRPSYPIMGDLSPRTVRRYNEERLRNSFRCVFAAVGFAALVLTVGIVGAISHHQARSSVSTLVCKGSVGAPAQNARASVRLRCESSD